MEGVVRYVTEHPLVAIKETAGDLGKTLGGDRDAGNRQKP